MTLLASFAVIYGGFVAEMPLSLDRKRYLFCTIQLQRLVDALASYRSDCGKFPQELQRLVSDEGVQGWHGPYIKEVPLDPWGRPFLYLRSSDRDVPEILSYGADGKPGGDFLDTDLSSHHPGRIIPTSPSEMRALWLIRGVWIGAWICFIGSIVVLRKMARRKLSDRAESSRDSGQQ
jgi:general secretion pathway protein G